MRRRTWLCGAAAAGLAPLIAHAADDAGVRKATAILADSVARGETAAATLAVRRGDDLIAQPFGRATSVDALFLMGSITKPICMTALMTLFDQRRFALEDPVVRHLPQFTGAGRDAVTIRHLLTHTSGLPDQLDQNNALRARQAPIADFVSGALQTPLAFPAGTKYSYSSMGILLAAEIAQRLSGKSIQQLTQDVVLTPLEMRHSAIGVGRFGLEGVEACQTERAAPESGAGDPAAKNWDWNSPYWRTLGAPWGGAHCSAPDVVRFLSEFLQTRGRCVRPETARLMRANHNPAGLTPRGLGFALGTALAGPQCSAETFGHTGSTGTIAWADPRSGVICVILTTLPGRAVTPHPRQLASDALAASFAGN